MKISDKDLMNLWTNILMNNKKEENDHGYFSKEKEREESTITLSHYITWK